MLCPVRLTQGRSAGKLWRTWALGQSLEAASSPGHSWTWPWPQVVSRSTKHPCLCQQHLCLDLPQATRKATERGPPAMSICVQQWRGSPGRAGEGNHTSS